MTIDEGLNELARQSCPRSVNVVPQVMAHVSQHPYLQSVRRVQVWQRLGWPAVAAAVVCIVAGAAIMRMNAYDEAGIGNMISQVHDYSYYSTVDQAAVNPIEYLYEE